MYNVSYLLLFRRNSHNVPRKTILKMLDRFEKDITVEMLLRKANPVKTKKESSQLSEPMDVTYTDEVVRIENHHLVELRFSK